MRPTISALCPTGHPGPLVAAALGPLSEVVDELIIAADARVEPEDLAWYQSVATRVLRFEFVEFPRHWPWLISQAQGDWLMLLDGDELPSAALLEALPELVRNRHVQEFAMPIHWSWPDAGHRLSEEPWSSDSRFRVVRNTDRVRFGVGMHSHIARSAPTAYVELPVYHLDLLMNSEEQRVAKVRDYDSRLFGLLTPEGLPFNAALYLPERTAGPVASVPVPAVDRDRIARALAPATGSPPPETAAFVPPERVAGRDEINRIAGFGEVGTLEIEPLGPPPPLTTAVPSAPWWLRVRNAGPSHWPGGMERQPSVRVGVRWESGDGAVLGEQHVPLPHALQSGHTALVPATLVAPVAGPLSLTIEGVLGHERWLGDPQHFAVTVGPSGAEQLAALPVGEAGLLDLADVWAVRRAIGGRDCLVGCGSRSEAEAMTELVAAVAPATALMVGASGPVVLLAAALATFRDDRESRRLVVLEQDPDLIHRVQLDLVEEGLRDVVQVQPGALGEAHVAQVIEELQPALSVVAGRGPGPGDPPTAALDAITASLHQDTYVAMGDAFSDFGLSAAEACQARPDVTLHGIRPTTSGLLELTLHAAR